MPVRKRGTVKRVVKKEGALKVRLSPEEKQAALKETFDVLRGLKREEFNLISQLNKRGVDRKAVEQRLLELNREISSLEKTLAEAPSLKSKTLQRALEPQIGALFVSKPGRQGHAEVRRDMNQIKDFVRNANEIIKSGRISPEAKRDLTKMVRAYEEKLRELEEYEKAYLKRKGD